MMIAYLSAPGIGLSRTAGVLTGVKKDTHVFVSTKMKLKRWKAHAIFNLSLCYPILA